MGMQTEKQIIVEILKWPPMALVFSFILFVNFLFYFHVSFLLTLRSIVLSSKDNSMCHSMYLPCVGIGLMSVLVNVIPWS